MYFQNCQCLNSSIAFLNNFDIPNLLLLVKNEHKGLLKSCANTSVSVLGINLIVISNINSDPDFHNWCITTRHDVKLPQC